MKKAFFLFICLFCAAGGHVFAQGGSNYSVFGLGDIRRSGGALYDGLGGTSLAVPSDYGINLLNPAAWSYVRTTRLQAAYVFNQRRISDGTNTVNQNNGRIDGITGLFALDTASGAALSIGIYPYSAVNYLFSNDLGVDFNGLKVQGTREISGSGGLSAAYLGLSYRPLKDLSVGLSGNTLFGSIQSSENIRISDTLGRILSESRSTRNDALRGTSFRLGLMYSGIQNLTLGLSATSFLDLEATPQRIYRSGVTDTIRESQMRFSMPLQWGIGASYVSGKFMVAGDFEMQDFSGFGYRTADAVFRPAMRISLGLSRLGNRAAGSDYLDQVNYNFGAGYQDLYYQTGGQNISEYYGSFGMQIPLAGNAMLDAAVTGGLRGKSGNGLVQEMFLRMSFAASIGETWFQPFARQ